MSKPLNERPYAEWLEGFLKQVNDLDPEKICVVTSNPDGTMLSGYFNCSCMDKGAFANQVILDFVQDAVEANADRIVKRGMEMLEEGEDDDMEL